MTYIQTATYRVPGLNNSNESHERLISELPPSYIYLKHDALHETDLHPSRNSSSRDLLTKMLRKQISIHWLNEFPPWPKSALAMGSNHTFQWLYIQYLRRTRSAHTPQGYSVRQDLLLMERHVGTSGHLPVMSA
jgi:hypothetical protein